MSKSLKIVNDYLEEHQVKYKREFDAIWIDKGTVIAIVNKALNQSENVVLDGVVEPKGKLEMFQNMQYYMEYCQRKGYITPQDWLEKKKHF